MNVYFQFEPKTASQSGGLAEALTSRPTMVNAKMQSIGTKPHAPLAKPSAMRTTQSLNKSATSIFTFPTAKSHVGSVASFDDYAEGGFEASFRFYAISR